jgi:lipopolysaccharide transport system ATP-binding protein
MAQIIFENVSLHYPLLSNGNNRIKDKFIKFVKKPLRLDKINNDNVVAINQISLVINSGDRVAITGGNGSGKSTLLKMMAGIYPPTNGRVLINGSVLSLLDLSMGIEHDATGVENVEMLTSIYKDRLDLTFLEVLHKVIAFSELDEFIYLPVKTYSSGMRMRLLFSFVLCLNTDILLMDEWLSVGDDDFNKKSLSAITEMHQKSKIVIMATHSRDVVDKYSNREIRMENGVIKNS